jgi:hypothetical protein
MVYEVSGSGDLGFGKRIVDLTLEEAERARELMQDRGLSVYCFSTQLLEPDIELGEAVFRDEHLEKVNHTIEIARIMQPKMIRSAGGPASRAAIADSSAYDGALLGFALFSCQGLDSRRLFPHRHSANACPRHRSRVLTGPSVSCFILLSFPTDRQKLSSEEEMN